MYQMTEEQKVIPNKIYQLNLLNTTNKYIIIKIFWHLNWLKKLGHPELRAPAVAGAMAASPRGREVAVPTNTVCLRTEVIMKYNCACGTDALLGSAANTAGAGPLQDTHRRTSSPPGCKGRAYPAVQVPLHTPSPLTPPDAGKSPDI